MTEEQRNFSNLTPTLFDLHREQIRQSAILGNLQKDVEEIRCVLVGSNQREGLVVDVDRLKRSKAMIHAMLVLLVTAVVTGGVRMFFGMFGQG